MALTELDLRGLKCPLPVLRARRALSRMPPGSILALTATDPMAAIDIPHMCSQDGHELISAQQPDDRSFRFEIRRGPHSPEATGKP